MRSLLKLSLAALAAVALFAGMAMAQDKPTLNVNLDLVGSLNIFSDSLDTKNKTTKAETTTAMSAWSSQWQADWNINASLGNAGGRSKIRFRDDQGTNPNTNRSELWYNFSDSFGLRWHIRSLGLPATTIAYSVYTGTTTTAGWPTDVAGPNAFWVNQSGLDIQLHFGAHNAGVVLFDACSPSCGYTAQKVSGINNTALAALGTLTAGGTATGAPVSTGNKDQQGIVPYYYGSFGPVTLGVFLASNSAKVATTKVSGTKTEDNDQSVTSSLADVNGKVDLGAAQVGFEYGTWSQSCAKKVAGFAGTKCDPQTNALTVVGARINAGPGRVEAHIAMQKTDNSFTLSTGKTSFHQDWTDVMAGYAIPMNASFWLVPVYEARTTNEEQKTGTAAVKIDNTIGQSLIGLAARGIF